MIGNRRQDDRTRDALIGMLTVGVALAPLFGGPVWQILGAQAFAVAIAVLGLVVVTGFSGQVSLCQATFMGFGGYIFAHCTEWQSNATTASSTTLQAAYGSGGARLPFLVALALTGVGTAIVGAVVGFPALRVRGLKLAILTIGFSAGAFVWFYNAQWTGANGGLTLKGDSRLLGASTSDVTTMYVVGAAVFVALGLIVRRVRDSSVGRRFALVRGHEDLARTLGVRPWAYKVLAFAAGAGIAGIGGAVFVRSQGVVAPESFTLFQSIVLAAVAVIGGVRSPLGALVGAWGIVGIPELLTRLEIDPGVVALPMGAAMLLVLALRQAGLFGARVGTYREPGPLAGLLSLIGTRFPSGNAARRVPAGT
jgi:branched-chain amino acid transport system permease protein